MQQCLCQSYALAKPTGEVPDQSVPDSTQLKSSDGLVECRGKVWSCHATKLSDEGQILRDRQFLVDRRRFREIPDLPLHLQGLISTVEPCYACRAFCRGHETGQNPHRRRLAGPVGAKKGQHFSLRDRKGDTINGRVMAVPLRNVVNVNHESDVGANSCGECGAVLLSE